MALPKISVLITCYNRYSFIEEAIQSVLDSSFGDFELIIVDDNSTDGSRQLISRYEGTDPRIRIFYNDVNLGQFQNRNYAASLASCEYIKFLDSDDLLYEKGLEIFYHYAINYPDVAVLISSDLLHDEIPYPILLNPRQSMVAYYLEYRFPCVGPSAVMFKKNVFDSFGGFSARPYVGSDIDLLIDLAMRNNILVIQSGLIWYRRHSNQELVIGTENNDYLLNDYYRKKSILLSDSNPMSNMELKLANRNLSLNYLKVIFKLITKCKFQLFFIAISKYLRSYYLC
jgi:glycosyltransferase involved in cell wall biosynthesis